MEKKIEQALIELKKQQEDGQVFPCPRCGHYRMDKKTSLNALSRHADVYVCDRCGVDEAIRDMKGEVLPLTKWSFAAMFKGENQNG